MHDQITARLTISAIRAKRALRIRSAASAALRNLKRRYAVLPLRYAVLAALRRMVPATCSALCVPELPADFDSPAL